MCGIVGYAGRAQAAPILLDGLAKLEYRGYDSAGICTYSDGRLRVKKAQGRLQVLSDLTDGGRTMPGTLGIGHTRWATHGAPSDVNAHPHLSADGKIALVHNGIIENYLPLKERLQAAGVPFRSETDTEVAVNLIAWYYAELGNFQQAVLRTLDELEGSYAFAVLCSDDPDTLIAVKKDSPLILGLGEDCNFVASAVPAILKYTREVCYLEDGQLVVLTADSVRLYDRTGKVLPICPEHVDWELDAAEKGGYPHFMLKEIYEQPTALSKTISPRIREGKIALDDISLDRSYLSGLKRMFIVACGSAYYVGCVGKYLFEDLCRIPVEPMLASEFRYCNPIVDEHTLVLIISQSGETADTLAALREAKRLGARTLAIVNVVGSSISKEADDVLYTWAGPEIAVATTKAYSTQLALEYLLAVHFARELGTMDEAVCGQYLERLQVLPEQISAVLAEPLVEEIKTYANDYHMAEDVYFIGRNVDSASCLEGCLKLKEIAYIHSEAYAAGELKHGPISLIQNGTLVVAVATNERLFEKTMSNVKEVKARGGSVLAITTERFRAEIQKTVDHAIVIPETAPLLQPSLSVVPLQLFAYYISLFRGCDIDKPRNLAKSVTVE